MREAMYWEAQGNRVRCALCPHGCSIAPGETGRCHVRRNREGTLISETWGLIPALALDPIEKKPLRRFHSGSWILSAGSYGCNLSCLFCQNHGISQRGADHQGNREGETRVVEPQPLVEEALALREEGNIGIAFTYNEPFVGYEYLWDTLRPAKEAGLVTVLVTNGFVNPAPLERLLPYVDAMNIDVKAFTDGFYRDLCGASLDPVLETVRRAAARCHVELTTLVIPGENSGTDEIGALARWIASVDPSIPLHLNRHHPDYLMPSPPPVERESLYRLAETARMSLSHVYVGNV